MPNIDLSILNQRQTPAFYADTLANRPAAGFVGRIFVSTNTFAFYRDNGTGWDLIGGPGTGTITGSGTSGQIALWDGASTITGDTGLTYNGTDNSLTASKFIVTGGTSSQFLKADGSVDSSSYVPYTGATASLVMGANNILAQNYYVDGNGTNSGGFLGIKQYSGSSSGTNGYTSISALTQNSLYFQFSQTNGTNKTFELSTALLGTTIRQYQLPNADGTLALTSDILNIYNSNGTLSSERTVSLNNFNLIFDGGATTARVRLDADTNVARIFSFATNNLPRFAIRVDGTESGGNTGSDYAIRRYDDAGTFVDAPLTITRSTGQSTFAKKVVIENNAGDQQLQIVSTTAPSLRFDNLQTGATKRAGLGISTATNNFIQGSADRDFCIFNGSTAAASPILFGIYDAGAVNVQEAARISAARNFLLGTTTDAGQKLQVSGSSKFTTTTSPENLRLVYDSTFSDAFIFEDTRSVSGSGTWRMGAGTGGVGFGIYSNTLAATPFFISSTGAATFSNNVNIKTGGASFQWTNSGNNVAILADSGYLRFDTGTSGYNERMRILADGKVGIGNWSVNTPQDLLHVNGAIQVGFVNSLNSAMRLFWNGASSYGAIQTASSSALALNPSGNNVLIGTTTDNGNKLQVSGTATIGKVNSIEDTFTNIGNGATATIYTMAASQMFLVYITEGATNQQVTFTSSVAEGSAFAYVGVISTSGAGLTVTASGLNIQVTNTTGTTITCKHTIIRIK